MQHILTGENALEWNGTEYKTLISAAETGGAISVLDTVSYHGSGPPRHVHEREDEIMIITTGAMELWMAGASRVLQAGEAAMIPRGVEHTFKIISETPCRHFLVLTPGGFESFFQEMARGQFRIPEDMPVIAETAGRHSLTFTGPPL